MSEVGLKAFWHYDMATSPQWSESRMWYPVGVAPLVRDPNPHLPGGVARWSQQQFWLPWPLTLPQRQNNGPAQSFQPATSSPSEASICVLPLKCQLLSCSFMAKALGLMSQMGCGAPGLILPLSQSSAGRSDWALQLTPSHPPPLDTCQLPLLAFTCRQLFELKDWNYFVRDVTDTCVSLCLYRPSDIQFLGLWEGNI